MYEMRPPSAGDLRQRGDFLCYNDEWKQKLAEMQRSVVRDRSRGIRMSFRVIIIKGARWEDVKKKKEMDHFDCGILSKLCLCSK